MFHLGFFDGFYLRSTGNTLGISFILLTFPHIQYIHPYLFNLECFVRMPFANSRITDIRNSAKKSHIMMAWWRFYWCLFVEWKEICHGYIKFENIMHKKMLFFCHLFISTELEMEIQTLTKWSKTKAWQCMAKFKYREKIFRFQTRTLCGKCFNILSRGVAFPMKEEKFNYLQCIYLPVVFFVTGTTVCSVFAAFYLKLWFKVRNVGKGSLLFACLLVCLFEWIKWAY